MADMLSRMYELSIVLMHIMIESYTSDKVEDLYLQTYLHDMEDDGQPLKVEEKQEVVPQAPEYYLKKVHGGRMPHKGVRGTWLALNKHFPGHNIPFRVIVDFVSTCAWCQKDRLAMTNNIGPLTLHLKPPHQRARVGVDRLTITPADENGNCNLVVIVDFWTKYVDLYPCKDYNAYSLATALFQYVCTNGLFDELWSDPGSDMTSEVVALLNSWFGMRHVFSLVNRHESNGVEGSNKQILRHIRVLVHEERMEKRWSHPTILPLIKFILNDSVNSETGLRPFDAKFGSEQGTYLRLPECADSAVVANTWLRNLNADLSILRDISKRHQDELIKERTANNPPLESYNKYQPGDFVLYMVPTDKPKPTKLTSPFLGPYKVIRHEKNDVEAQHVVMGTIRVFHVTSLKLFMGTPAEAQELAQRDADQHMILNIRAYIGDPKRRTTCEFEVEFIDGSILWLPWSTDLFDTLQYEQFCRENMELYPLLFTTSEANNHIKMIRSQNIIMVQPGVEVYLKLLNI